MRIGKAMAVLACGLVACAAWSLRAADEPAGGLVILDAGGKEQRLKAWKFATGVRRLGWLARAGKPDSGPEALEVREENSTTFVDGILTLVPLDRVRALDYDNEKQTVTVRARAGDKEDAEEKLVGSTQYQRINKLTIEAEVDKGDLGVAEVKYLGGTAKGIKGVRFPAAKAPEAAPAGRPAVVVNVDRQKKTEHKVTDLLPLYRTPDGGQRLTPVLMFKKTLRLDVNKIQKIRASERDAEGTEWLVTLKDGEEHTLTLLPTVPLDGKQATLEGLLGRVPSGYKLFPVAVVTELYFDDAKPEAKPDKP